jgi:hypothetical protein
MWGYNWGAFGAILVHLLVHSHSGISEARDRYLIPLIQGENQIDQRKFLKRPENIAHDPVSVIVTSRTGLYHEHLDGHLIKTVEERHGNQVLFYVANDYDEVIRTFSGLQHLRIANLYILGFHGSSYERVTDFSAASEEMFSVFDLEKQGISLKFLPGATITTDACSSIERGSPDQVKEQMSAWKKIGFQTGWIYMNYTDGNVASLNVYGVPIYKQIRDGSYKEAAARFGAGIYFMYLETVQENQGFLLGVSKRRWVLLNTTFGNGSGGRPSGTYLGGQ